MPKIYDFKMFIRQNVYHEDDRWFVKDNQVAAQTQRGQTCKLNALSTAINAMSMRLGLSKPLPVRGHSRTTNSIRQLAKAKYRSVVGEIYSPVSLRLIASDLGYTNISIHSVSSFDDYRDVIVTAVNKGETPIVFFDVSDDGEPKCLLGEREHAAVISGIFYNRDGELGFIYTQWGDFYWSMAKDVYASTAQLQEHRRPETFYKYNGKWFDSDSVRKLPSFITDSGYEECRKARAAHPIEGGLRLKVFIVHDPQLTQEASFWSPPPQALVNAEFEQLFEQDLRRKNII